MSKEDSLSIKKEVNLVTNEIEDIKNLIYTIRNKQIMLDSDVAILYNYTTKRINEAVRRNIARFPENFCFQLTEKEVENLRSQNETASKRENDKFRNKKYLPYAFTEQGIAMLSRTVKK